MTERTDAFVGEVQKAMDDILSFWADKMQDPQGGFYGQMNADGAIDKNAPRGGILNARILWSFSAAYRATKNKKYLVTATKAKDYYLEHFMDYKYGGSYWSVDASGERLDTKKHAYAQGFTIYALSEYARATGDQSVLNYAINIFQMIEKKCKDEVNGGYIEARARDWSEASDLRLSEKEDNWAKSFNTHLHILEAYTSLYRVWPDKKLRDAIVDLLDIFSEKIYNAQTGHMNLFFDMEWNTPDYGCSYGHEIEAAWLLLDAAFKVGNIDVINKIRPVINEAANGGLEGLHPDGSMIYERHADGSLDTTRHWWVQAEAVVGSLWMWKFKGRQDCAEKALRTWNYIKNKMIAPCGEWYGKCDDSGNPLPGEELAGFWKCPYHNTRMCIQVLKIVKF